MYGRQACGLLRIVFIRSSGVMCPTTLLALRMLVALPFFVAMGAWAARRAPALSRGDLGRVALLGFSGYYLSS